MTSHWSEWPSLKLLTTVIRVEKEIKVIQIGKEETKLSLFADDMILYIKNPKDITRKILQLINEFGKITGYKINTQKYVAFLYTNNKRSEREIRKQSHLPSHQKSKNLVIKLPKKAKQLYSENYIRH